VSFETLIRNVLVYDGTGAAPFVANVALSAERIALVSRVSRGVELCAGVELDGTGLALAPGFIDAHSHDDLAVIEKPAMLPKLTQGVTTVVVGNCGISAAPVRLAGAPPDPLNLLGRAEEFRYPTFSGYAKAVDAAGSAVNVAALVGHTSLRQNHLLTLDRAASEQEICAMRAELEAALEAGALGLSSGLAYASAIHAPNAEVLALADALRGVGGVYCSHLRSEAEPILEALEEAFEVGRQARIPVTISHLKCAGLKNYGRSSEVLAALEGAARELDVGCDCYPYTASSSTLDLRQVQDGIEILITWSDPHPELGGRLLADIARDWGLDSVSAARRLQPAGAVYHCMAEPDVERILKHPLTMIGSDGLPNDPRPHPRLWGAFPRVLGHWARERGLLSLEQAIHKMTGQTAARFGLADRGLIREGARADLVLFDAKRIGDRATYSEPELPAAGIAAVWVNGVCSLRDGVPCGVRAGRFLPRAAPAQ
jgi:N-acyl-D-amino-acid deacylase